MGLQLTEQLHRPYVHHIHSRIHLLFPAHIYAYHPPRFFENWCKKIQAQFFLTRLLALFLEDWPCFCFVALVALLGFVLGLAIIGAVTKGEDVAVGLSGLSWW